MRITGLATGLDMDEIIKSSMKPYRIKIDKRGQDKEILEIRQKLYRDVLKDSRELYNKYFDVTNSKSLLLSRNWSPVSLTSSSDAVTVTGSGDAKAESYKVTGTNAKAAKVVKTDGLDVGNELVINGEKFILKGSTVKERANNLNNELKTKGINVSVRYTDFAGTVEKITDENGKEIEKVTNKSGFVFESTVLGIDSKFTLSGTLSDSIGTVTQGSDAKAATLDAFTKKDLEDANGIIEIDGVKVEIDITKDIQQELQSKLKDRKLTAEVDESGKITFKSLEPGEKEKYPSIKIGEGEDNTKTLAGGENAKEATNTLELNTIANKKISINGNLIDLTGKGILKDITDLTEAEIAKDKEDKLKEVVDYLNKVLKEQGIPITASNKEGNVLLTSNVAGSKSNIDVKELQGSIELFQGNDAEITIENISSGGVFTHTGIDNTVVLDGIEFKFNSDIPNAGVTISSKQDVTEIKDNLVKFINDYNTLVEKLNKLTMERKNKDYSPLTADQKKEMSEEEVKLWNSKVEQGQLSRDNDLTRINNSLKQAMRTLVDGTGLNLEKIGIMPVKDYAGTKNGTYTIDENKLSKALSENTEEIMNMFIKAAPKDDTLSAGTKYSQTGMMNRIKDVLYGETISISAILIKKAGFEGTSSGYNNEITLSIQKYEQKMKDMEKDFSRREQALYIRYANLEAVMNKYNSQQSYLMQQLGLG